MISSRKLEKIPAEKLPKFLGELVHVTWARNGCVWRLIEINGEVATLETTATFKIVKTHISNLCATRANEKLINE